MKKIIFAFLICFETYALEITPDTLKECDNVVTLSDNCRVSEEVKIQHESSLRSAWRTVKNATLMGITFFVGRELYVRYQSYSTDGFLCCQKTPMIQPLAQTCAFYKPFIDSGNTELRALATDYRSGCLAYSQLHKMINEHRLKISEIEEMLRSEIVQCQEDICGWRERLYIDALNKISYHLKIQNRTLWNIQSFSEEYIPTLESDFITYIGRNNWYCSGFRGCLGAVADYFSEYRRYHVINIPEYRLQELQEHLSEESKMLQTFFPMKGVFHKKRRINLRMIDIQNLTEALVESEECATKLYDAINPSFIKRVSLGEPSSLWKACTKTLENAWGSITDFLKKNKPEKLLDWLVARLF